MTARKRHTLRNRVRLIERSAPQRRVDPERGILYGVKMLGLRSLNGRRYAPEAVRRAAHMYEGVGAFVDHPDDPDDQRSSRDRIGVFHNVRYVEGRGLYGDLHLIKSKDMAAALIEAAANPKLHGAFSCSHNAEGDLEVIDGETVVTEIGSVNSVDIVADGATAQSLFESARPLAPARTHPRKHATDDRPRGQPRRRSRPMKLREWFDRIPLLKPERKRINRLFESAMDPDAEMMYEADEDVATMPDSGADPAEMDPEGALKQGFRSAMVAVIDDGTLPVKDKIGRLKELLTTADKLLGEGVDIPEEEHAEPDGDEFGGFDDGDEDDDELVEADDSGCDDEELMEGEDADAVLQPSADNEPLRKAPEPSPKKKTAGMKESKLPKTREGLRRSLLEARGLLEARALCDEHGVDRPDAALLEALAAVSPRSRRALLERIKSGGGRQSRPRTTAAEWQAGDAGAQTDTDKFVAKLTGGDR